MTVERTPIPTDERKPTRCRACLAYREMRRTDASDHEAHLAAVAAVQVVLPLSWKEASTEAVNAVAYATRYHSDWFWRGAQHEGKMGEGGLVAAASRSAVLLHELSREPISPAPEGACRIRAPFPLIVDAFLVRTAYEPIGSNDRFHAVA